MYRAAIILMMVIGVAMLSSCATVNLSQDASSDVSMSTATVKTSVDEKTVQKNIAAKEVENVVKPEPMVEKAVTPAAQSMVTETSMQEKISEHKMKMVPPIKPVAKWPLQDVPPNTFLVSVAVKDSSHLFFGMGSKSGMVVNGEQGKELIVVRGQSYTFKIDTGVKHDFYLSRSSKGWGAATLAEGVKGNFTYKGVVRFTPGVNTPSVVYYQCRNHKNMGSKIHVVDKGGEAKVVLGVREFKKPGMKRMGVKSAFTSGNQAKQKVKFAEMFIALSPAAKRIEASDNADAKRLLKDAHARLEDAKASISAGKSAQKTIEFVDEALRSMTMAAKLVPSKAELGELRAKYKELLDSSLTYEKSYRRNLKMMKKKGKKDLPDLDIEKISVKITLATQLAEENKFAAANKKLVSVQRAITGALTKLLADVTMDYTLNFDDPKEEYEYELSRYKSFAELVPIAVEQKRPSKQMLSLMNPIIEKAKGIYQLSGPKAEEGDFKTAVQMLQGATSHLQRALRFVGVR